MQSILQLIPSSFILLVHNGSLKPHQDFLMKKFPEITHIVLPINLGYSGGANFGLRAGFQKSPWILFLTNDCQLREFKVPTSNPALIAPLIWARRENNVDSIGGNFNVQKARLSHCRTPEDFQNSKYSYAPGTALWIHQQVFEKASGFDESLGTYWEDVDFSMRVRLLGFPVLADLNTKVLHAVGKTCHKDPYYSTYLYQRNRKRISIKYSKSLGLYAVLTWGYLLESWIEFAIKCIQRRNWAKLKLLWQATVQD